MIIGLTGQTGAGKSTVCAFLKEKAIAVIDCDKVSREVTEKGSALLKKLADAFGADVLFKDGSLNRKCLAEKAFSSKEKTRLLNSITHPEILKAIKEKINELDAQNILLDAPTLFESGADKLCDKIIAVVADENLRKSRITARDNLTEKQVSLRLSAQKDDKFYIEKADAVIINNGGTSELKNNTEKALQKIGVI
ncbi:MAG: dephospho-CoA kinase [Ruminococcaceae bacterium]|nr:dephospho-CoA kinase [Oscillospiraceae bacterium]